MVKFLPMPAFAAFETLITFRWSCSSSFTIVHNVNLELLTIICWTIGLFKCFFGFFFTIKGLILNRGRCWDLRQKNMILYKQRLWHWIFWKYPLRPFHQWLCFCCIQPQKVNSEWFRPLIKFMLKSSNQIIIYPLSFYCALCF